MLTYELDRSVAVSLYEQLYRCIRADIESGTLLPGERLPPKRTLARHLGISPITIENALAQLVAEGYVTAEERKGYFVAFFQGALPCQRQARRSKADASPATLTEETSQPTEYPSIADLTGTTAPIGLFPYRVWTRTVRAALAEGSEESLLTAAQPQGSPTLRAAIAEHLRGFRGMDVEPERIVIGAGAQVLYQLIAQLLTTRSRIALEDPGYPRLQRVYESMGMRTYGIPVIGDGSSLDHLRSAPFEAIHCMPSHQFPTGITMTAPARCALLEWAHDAPERYLIEDDYDCEFRMQGMPITALAAIDDGTKVIYLNTYTKSLGGAFRIGYMVLPRPLVKDFRERLSFYSCTVGGIDQATLCRFITTGNYERHCNRQRNHYRRISHHLSQALTRSIEAWGGTLLNVGAGLHFVMRVDALADEQKEGAFVEALQRSGVKMAPLSAYRHIPSSAHDASDIQDDWQRAGSFLVSFSSVKDEHIASIAEAVRRALAYVLT